MGFEGRVVAVVGLKDTGKTGVVEGLVACLAARGFSVGTVKHVHGKVALEPATVDSGRHLAAGAVCAVTVSDAMVQATRGAAWCEWRGAGRGAGRGGAGKSKRPAGELLEDAMTRHLAGCDCVVVEGFKASGLPKVAVTVGGKMPPGLKNVVACVYRGARPAGLPAFRPGEVKKLAAFLLGSGVLKPGGQASHLSVNGRPVPMNEFVARALAGVIQGFVGTLRGVEPPDQIELTIKRGR